MNNHIRLPNVVLVFCLILSTNNFVDGVLDFTKLDLSAYYNAKPNNVPQDAILTTPELIMKHGYHVETHDDIITEDGYILTLHRIPHSQGNHSTSNIDRPVVLIQHGFLANSAEGILSGPKKAIGYYFSEAGFDVWLGNARGSRYNTKHKYTSKWSRKYWDYSFSDIGYYDLPAMIDYILNHTKKKKLYYIGHSRGTTSFFVMCAARPEYNKKIQAMAGVAPIAYMTNIPNPLYHVMAYNMEFIENIAKSLNIYQLTLNNKILSSLCSDGNFTQLVRPNVCLVVAFILGGFDFKNFDTSGMSILVGHVPDSISIKELTHYGQAVLSSKFQDFDYGPAENMRKYRTFSPPQFNLTKVVAPVALFYSANDLMSSVIDADVLVSELGNIMEKHYLVEGPDHFSYFHGRNGRDLYYDKILNMFMKMKV